MCNNVNRMTLCKTSLIVSCLDCCRDFKFKTSKVSAGQKRANAAEVGQHLTLFACAPNDYAYDGKNGHGSESIARDNFVE